MGIWQGERISLYFFTLLFHPPPKTFAPSRSLYHAESAVSFLGADVKEAGNRGPFQAMGDAQEDRVTCGQESRARILPNRVDSNQTCWSDKKTDRARELSIPVIPPPFHI